MRKNSENMGNIEKLEDEIRKLATPYASEDPGSLYWSNFRVRVMERVAQDERKAGWFAQIPQFLAGHIWGTSFAISAAALLVAGIMLVQPFGENAPLKPGVSPAPVAIAPAPMSLPAKPDLAVAQNQSTASGTNGTHRSYAAKHASVARQTDLASSAEALPTVDDDHPVSLDDLSQPELEAVLQGLQNNE